MANKFNSVYSYKVIYVFRINDEAHQGMVKIGDATYTGDKSIDELLPNCHELNQAAKKRIDSYTSPAGIRYDLLHTELAVYVDNKGRTKAFRDYNVHRVLANSNIKKIHTFDKAKEWFETDLATAKNAIAAVKNNQIALSPDMVTTNCSPIIFRPEQDKAIEETVAHLKKNDRMLWNAKMRFGKTLCALQVVKELGFHATIIATHRPDVRSGWRDDFDKIFYDTDEYMYISKDEGPMAFLIAKNSGKKFVYFASIQDLRGSQRVGGKHDKNDDIFDYPWDFVIVDEAHEGTTTELGKSVLDELVKGKANTPKSLSLSGTPFNILNDFDTGVYTWDYIMEQTAKAEWDEYHNGDSNPYAELPTLNIFTYDLSEMIANSRFVDFEDKAFNFREFFRTYTGDIKKDGRPIPANKIEGQFVHEKYVKEFLDLLTLTDENSNYPFSTEEYRELFKHSLWMIPGVKEAKALSALLQSHPVFGCGQFDIVNVAGDGDEYDDNDAALIKVRNALDDAAKTGKYTITLSCGKLTTGVTIPEWTAVFMLSGSYSTSAANYLQTIFRVQSPANIDGKIKENCYVFDFAPDRTLKMVAESVKISAKRGGTSSSDREILREFLNFCPIIAFDGSRMYEYNTDRMLQQLKRAYAERAVESGFEDESIYNIPKLQELTGEQIDLLNGIRGIIGTSNKTKKMREIIINEQGMNEEEYDQVQMPGFDYNKQKQEISEEEKRLRELHKQKNKQRKEAISILRGISIRIPLLIYGAKNVEWNDDITIYDLPDIVDDASWKEFMPNGITKSKFKEIMEYYDEDVFIAAGHRIRRIVKGADALEPTERVKKLSDLFATFKNPDKETVLTPWRVVNMHMSDCLGGYCFFDDKFEKTLVEPRYVDQGEITEDTLRNENAQLLEINSKTGLYPLYLVYSLYRNKCPKLYESDLTFEQKKDIWYQVVKDNIFVICKTPMAKSITERTLIGFDNKPINIHYFDDLVNQIQNKPKQFKEKVLAKNYWHKGSGEMIFDAIVGNPPYQETISRDEANSSLGKQLFPYFIINAINLNANYVSFITPSRWFTADAQDKSFLKLRDFMKDNNHIKKIFNYPNSHMVFPEVEIAGGVNYFLFENGYKGDTIFKEIYKNSSNIIERPLFEKGLSIVLAMNSFVSVLNKVTGTQDFIPLTTVTQGRNAFGIVGKKSELESKTVPEYFDGAIEVRCAYEEIRYTSIDNVTKNLPLAKSWKIFTSKGNGGAGVLMDDKPVAILGKAYLGKPYSVCTDSLIPIGCYDSETEAVNLQKYMATKFLRFMVGILKVSQNVYQNVYQFVPIQDFTSNSDIDWKQSIENIDKQLYDKYGLNSEEISYIEEKIKPME